MEFEPPGSDSEEEEEEEEEGSEDEGIQVKMCQYLHCLQQKCKRNPCICWKVLWQTKRSHTKMSAKYDSDHVCIQLAKFKER